MVQRFPGQPQGLAGINGFTHPDSPVNFTEMTISCNGRVLMKYIDIVIRLDADYRAPACRQNPGAGGHGESNGKAVELGGFMTLLGFCICGYMVRKREPVSFRAHMLCSVVADFPC